MRCPQVLASLLVLALAGCGGLGQRPLRLGLTDWPAYEYFYLAESLGLARAEGLRLQVRQHSSLEDQRFSYERGDVEAIAVTVSDALAICQQVPPRCPELVLVLDESRGADQLIARRGTGGLAGLAGQRVGLEHSLLGEYLLQRALETVGLGLGDVRLEYGGPRALLDRFRDGELAAVVTYPPHSEGLQRDPRFRALFSSNQLPREVVDVLAVSPELARRHPDQVRALVATWWAARRQAASDPAAAAALMARRQGVSVAQFRHSEQAVHYAPASEQARWLGAGGWLESAVARQAERLRATGRLARATPLPRINSGWVRPENRP